MKFVKYYFWFIKESISFMKPCNPIITVIRSIPKAWGFAKESCAWDKLTHKQKEAWYLSGEGRILEF